MIYLPAKSVKAFVTVCIPTYNHASFIREAVSSVLKQDVEGLHIILSDDASTDGSREICRQLYLDYPGIISLILHDKNIGVVKNVECIYSKIPHTTKYLSWFAGDDIFLGNKLKKQIKFMEENPDYIMCYHDTLVQDKERNFSYRYNHPLLGEKSYQGDIFEKLIIYGCFISALSVLVRWESCKHICHNSNLGVSNDWLYFIELSKAGKVGYINEVLGIYRRHSNNITRGGPDIQQIVDIYLYIQGKYNKTKAVEKGLIKNYLGYSFKYLLEKHFLQGFTILGRSLSLSFKSPSNFLFLIKSLIFLIIQRLALLWKTGSITR